MTETDSQNSSILENNEPSESSSGGKSLSRLQNRNVFVLGLAFLLLYTAFQTMNGILQTVLDSYYTQHPDHGAEVNGLVSLGIFYGVCAISVWFAPWVITLMSPKAVMVMGALINTAYMTLFISAPNAPLVYIFSVLIGIAGAFIWVGQGTVLITNSNPETISRNTGIFFLMFESSLFVGNTFIYFTFDGAEYISDSTRVVVFSCLTAVSFLGLLTLFLIRPLPTTSQESENESDTAQLVGDGTQEVTQSKWNKASESAKTAFLNAIRILKTEQVLLQLVVWAYNGLEITFWSGILPTCIGNTMALPNRYSVVGLAGIVVGVGEMLGAFLTMITGRRSDPPRGPLIIFGMLCQGIGFYLCLLYLPDDSTTTRVGTFSPTWAEPSTASILTTAFFLGLGSVLYKVITRRSSPCSCAFLTARTNSGEKLAQNLQRRLDVSNTNRLTYRT